MLVGGPEGWEALWKRIGDAWWVRVPSADQLLAQVGALPAGAKLLERVPELDGVYLVGGAVRDLLRGGRPLDLDLVVDGDPAALASSLGGDARIHDRFGTSTVKLDGFTFDIARARAETYARPGALPEVQPAGVDQDLERRDFTVNAIAIALGAPDPGGLHAAPHALDDLERRLLRVLHDRSFQDDPTRMLRLARYASRLGFAAEPHTRDLLEAAVAGGALATVSGSRIGAELRLLAREPHPLAALRCADDLALASAIHPRFGIIDSELARRALALLPDDARRDRLAIALASSAIPAAELTKLLDALAFSAPDRDAIVAAAARAPEVAARLSDARMPSEIARAVSGAEPELVALAGALGPERQAKQWLTDLRRVRLEIDGADLLAAGVRQGPEIGRGLQAALAARLDGRISDRNGELAEALQAVRSAG
jgi:tRNA nucleotidyltransferase (CCA-adding enzyme)